ncbi:transmembrane protein 121-like protein [Platysternon megacephalum]|uniref:Transmembrane protein 121-like protein n=1 Tax=Platysternon megacephalum TaxID=55544 RepID=A0A4D9DZM0_9SAUR|nr:transmembrane protein 121-like protein [Platysternon megacephalum]
MSPLLSSVLQYRVPFAEKGERERESASPLSIMYLIAAGIPCLGSHLLQVQPPAPHLRAKINTPNHPSCKQTTKKEKKKKKRDPPKIKTKEGKKQSRRRQALQGQSCQIIIKKTCSRNGDGQRNERLERDLRERERES